MIEVCLPVYLQISYIKNAIFLDNVNVLSFSQCMSLISGADKELRNDEQETPLLAAVTHGQIEATRVLVLEEGCATNVRDNDNKTIVFLATEECHTKLLEVYNCDFPSFTS